MRQRHEPRQFPPLRHVIEQVVHVAVCEELRERVGRAERLDPRSCRSSISSAQQEDPSQWRGRSRAGEAARHEIEGALGPGRCEGRQRLAGSRHEAGAFIPQPDLIVRRHREPIGPRLPERKHVLRDHWEPGHGACRGERGLADTGWPDERPRPSVQHERARVQNENTSLTKHRSHHRPEQEGDRIRFCQRRSPVGPHRSSPLRDVKTDTLRVA